MQDIIVPPLNKEAAEIVHKNWLAVDEVPYQLGKVEKMVEKYAAICGTPDFEGKIKSAMLLMCGDHGIAKYGVSAYPQEVAGADVFVVDMGTTFDLSHLPKVRNEKVAWGTEDFTKGPAMKREQAEMALERGMKVAGECIDKGYNMLVTAEMGIGNTTSTAAIVSAFTGLAPELTVGRGTGINDERMKVKRQVVADGLAINKPKLGNAMDILCKVGGYDHAGLAGMIIEGARRRVPTMVDGVNATAAALLAYGIEPACADYMFCSHLSAEISHAKMLEILNLKPIVDAGMRLGEGTGASLAIVILQSALDLYKNLTAGEHNA